MANARAIAAILAGEPHPAREAVVLNAAAALVVATGDGPSRVRRPGPRAHRDASGPATLERWRIAAERAREARAQPDATGGAS